jgi:hypothetical protein
MNKLLFFGLLCLVYVYSTDYYLKPPETGGSDSPSCNLYETACGTIDHIMKTIVNVSGSNSDIYIDSGIYNYTVICGEGSETNAYKNTVFSLIGFILFRIIVFLYLNFLFNI